MKDRTFILKRMRENRHTQYRPEQLKLYEILVARARRDDKNANYVMEYEVKDLQKVDGYRLKKIVLDIANPDLKVCVRLMGQVHETKTQRIKDEDQKYILEMNGWVVEDIWHYERSELWAK